MGEFSLWLGFFYLHGDQTAFNRYILHARHWVYIEDADKTDLGVMAGR